MTINDKLREALPFRSDNSGFFISRGKGRHPTRRIDSYELIFVVGGTLKMFEEKIKYELRPGDCLILFPDRLHGGGADYPRDLSFYWIHFQIRDTAFEKIFRKMPRHHSLSFPDKMTRWFRCFLNEQEGELAPLQGDMLMALMISEFQLIRSNKIEGQNILAEKALKQIKINFGIPEFSTSKIAGDLQCNPDYLGRIFKRAYGKSLTESLNSQRIRHAQNLLLDSAMSIKQIALSAGYNDLAYFRRRFSKESGMSPARYRKLYGKLRINTT